MRRIIRPALRLTWNLAQLAIILAVLCQGARFTFRPDPLDALRRADGLFAAGRYHDALAAYRAIVSGPSAGAAAGEQAADRSARLIAPAYARLGMVHAVRGELPAASQALGYAVGLGLEPRTLDLVRLYQGRVAEIAGIRSEMDQFWGLVAADSPLAPLRDVLRAESRLRAGAYGDAERSYRAALDGQLPPHWRAVARTRLATLRGPADPAGALAELELAAPQRGPAALPLSDPLLPAPSPGAQQLAAALQAPPEQRQQLLGQLFLTAGLYPLAERQFATVPPETPDALSAAAYAAYTRLVSGDQAGGLRQLERLVASHPSEQRARLLLAMAYLGGRTEEAARAQVQAARALDPRAPAAYLVMGELYSAQRDYVAAAGEYARALRSAPPEERGTYALALARFHLETSLQVCEAGQPAAEEAVRLLPADPAAWTALAAARLACGQASSAAEAAREAARLSPTSPEAAYHLGRALAALGDRGAARSALVAAADLAPASQWRERAERQLAALGL